MTLPTVGPSSSFGHRVVARVARSALGIMVVRKIGQRIDPALIRFTGGRLSSVAPFPAMLLTHTGAKSGLIRTSTVVYFTDADRVTVIASNFGALHRPAWYYNVKAHPEVSLWGRGFGGPFHAEELVGSRTRPALSARYGRLLAVRPLSANSGKTLSSHRISPEPLIEAMAQRAVASVPCLSDST